MKTIAKQKKIIEFNNLLRSQSKSKIKLKTVTEQIVIYIN